MRVALFGPVTLAHLMDAELFAGISPQTLVSSGEHHVPELGVEHEEIPLDPMAGEAARMQNNWRIMLHADALVCVGANPHIVSIAERHGVPVYEAAA